MDCSKLIEQECQTKILHEVNFYIRQNVYIALRERYVKEYGVQPEVHDNLVLNNIGAAYFRKNAESIITQYTSYAHDMQKDLMSRRSTWTVIMKELQKINWIKKSDKHKFPN